MINIVEDVSLLTTINEQHLRKLSDIFIYCINDAIEEALLTQQDSIDLDVGFGTISINIDNNSIRYKFKPSTKLESSVSNTAVKESNELTYNLEKSLVDKLTNTYKSFL